MAERRYRVVHRSRYELEAEAAGAVACSLEAHLTPRALPHQSLEFHQLVVRPSPRARRVDEDAFGNRRARIELGGRFGSVEVAALSVVRLGEPPAGDAADLGGDWRAAAERTAAAAAADPALRALVEGTARAPRSEAVAGYARGCFPGGRPLGEALDGLVARIRRDFTYDPGATAADTGLDAFCALRRGVCQDFAHLAIACLRSMGLAARYASGYAAGAGSAPARASHAWASVWLPSGRWHDLDPTPGRAGASGHIVLGYGRDYDDVAPIRGTAEGARGAVLRTEIMVAPG
ncbi:transglutaminase family protein [Sorangium sp. So ce1036]|uniref:transglutaminase family protein n=1 Tax=Sorangium sp. So ce1036 TaxID=3133328 RepID=UPI003F0D3515